MPCKPRGRPMAKRRGTKRKQIMNRAGVKKVVREMAEVGFKRRTYSLSPDYNGTVYNLTDTISQGNADGQRDKDEIYLKGIEISGGYFCNTVTRSGYRLVLARFKQNTSVTTPSTSWFCPTALLGSVYTPHVPENEDTHQDMTILWDSGYRVPCNGANGSEAIKMKRKLNSKIKYNIGATTGTGHLVLYVVSDVALASAGNIDFVVKIKYQDF